MEAQRLRNLTTGKLHTKIEHVYQDLEYITGMGGLMTHMLPNVMRAVEPWLREKVQIKQYWDDQFNPDHKGEVDLDPMNEAEQAVMLERYKALPHPFAGRDPETILTVSS